MGKNSTLAEDVKIIQKAYSDHDSKEKENDNELPDGDTVIKSITKQELADLIKAAVGKSQDREDDEPEDDDDEKDDTPVTKALSELNKPLGMVFECGHCGEHNEVNKGVEGNAILEAQNEKVSHIAESIEVIAKAMGLVETLVKGQRVTLSRLETLEKAFTVDNSGNDQTQQQPINKGLIASVTQPPQTLSVNENELEKIGNLEVGQIEKVIKKAVDDNVLTTSDENYVNACLGSGDFSGLFIRESVKDVLIDSVNKGGK